MNKISRYIEAVAGGIFLRLLRASIRFEVENQPELDFACINAFEHRNLLLLALQRIDTNGAVMVSSSKDGEFLSGPLQRVGYVTVRGSSTRQGSQALKEMVRLAGKHSLAITPDGPKGPLGTIHPGLFQIAWLAKVPIIPIVAHTRQEWVFKSWDKFRFPKPFGKVKVIYGAPIYVADKERFQEAEQALRDAWETLNQDAQK